MKAIVTGAAGFIGLNPVDEFICVKNLLGGVDKNVHPRSEIHRGEIRNYELIRKLCSNSNYFFHMAAEKSIVRFPFEDTQGLVLRAPS